MNRGTASPYAGGAERAPIPGTVVVGTGPVEGSAAAFFAI